MSTNTGALVALTPLLGACLAAGLTAQTADTFVDTVDVKVVEVDVVVTDRKGRPVSGLKPEDLELYVDGAPVEIANFYESSIYGEPSRRRGPKVANAVPPDDPPAASASEGAPVTIAIYLDELNTYPAHRTRLLAGLAEAVGPWRDSSARFMLASFANRLEILVPPTTDLDKVLERAVSRTRSPAGAVQNAHARIRAMQNLIEIKSASTIEAVDPCEDSWDLMLTTARIHAEEEQTRGAVAVDGLADLVSTLGGLPGKKAVIYVSDGLAHRPGVSVFTYLVEQLCPADEKRHSEAYGEMMQYNEASRFNRVAAHANANRVTLFPVDAAGIRGGRGQHVSFRSAQFAPSPRNDNLHDANVRNGLHLLAHETGGKLLINSNDLADLLADVDDRLSVSYSLGFHAADRKPGEIRQVSVELARHAAKGRRIEYRRSYRDKSLDERLAERLLSVAYLGSPENPLEARVQFGEDKPLGGEIYELRVSVEVPVESILALPFRGGETGALRLWMLAVERESGVRTPVRQKELLVGGESEVGAVDDAYRFEVTMNLPEGDWWVAVGVRDETTGAISLLRTPVTVPAPTAGVPADTGPHVGPWPAPTAASSWGTGLP